MFCNKCGAQINDDSMFCQSCGEKVIESDGKMNNGKTKKFDGEVKKCPNCGEIVDSFCLKCTTCGYEFRNVSSSNAISNLSKSLDDIMKNQDDKRGAFDKFAGMMGFGGKIDKKTNNMIELIKNFSIPNTKEDILEFMIMSSSNINVEMLGYMNYSTAHMDSMDFSSKKALSEAWISKMNQAYQKSCISLKGEPVFNQIESIYKSKMNEIKKARFSSKIEPILLIAIFFAIILLCIMPLFLLVTMGSEKELNKIYQEIQVDINVGKYDEALVKANELRVSRSYSDSLADLWDEKREAIIKIIKEKKEGK